MDELIALVHSLHEKIDAMREEIEELKGQQRPMTPKDYTYSLKSTEGINFDTFIDSIKITESDIETVLLKSSKTCNSKVDKIDKNYLDILTNMVTSANIENAMKVFNNNKNTIYIFRNSKWASIKKEELQKLQTKIQTKMRECFRAMVKNKSDILNNDDIKEFSYMEQRNKISQVSKVSHTIFKNDLYKILISKMSSDV
jgi:hypothetical protein